MCTLTFWPTTRGGILTQNRDEQSSRSSITMVRDALTYPRDAKAGGTWAVASELGQVRCLLNGAYTKHQHLPPYKLSRGLMLLQSFEFETLHDFVQSFDFQGVEPFTIIDFSAGKLTEFRWNGHQVDTKSLPPDKPAIWSSCTLYSTEEQQLRAKNWQYWQPKFDDAAIEIWQLHTIRVADDAPLSLVRTFDVGAQTVSTIQFELTEGQTNIRYFERESGVLQRANLTSLTVNNR